MNTTPLESRTGVLSVAIRDRSALYAAYMGFVRGGGLFIPTSRPYRLGEELVLLLTLMQEPERLPVTGRVVWVTPRGAQGGKMAGVGIQFTDDDIGRAARNKIEGYLAGSLQSDRQTHTL
jgi:type IV pilus assembly protein PilZ